MKLKSVRLSKNLTLPQLAEKAGMHINTIGRFERGETPNFDSMKKLIQGYAKLGVDLLAELDKPEPKVISAAPLPKKELNGLANDIRRKVLSFVDNVLVPSIVKGEMPEPAMASVKRRKKYVKSGKYAKKTKGDVTCSPKSESFESLQVSPNGAWQEPQGSIMP